MEKQRLLEYVPFNSSINPSFWNKLTQLKLDVDKLQESDRNIWGYFTNINVETTPFLDVDSTAFNSNCNVFTGQCVKGKLLNKNTIEQFKECDKSALIQKEGEELWQDIENGNCIKDPSLLNKFFILSYADLKKYHYYYWFAFPTPANIDVVLNNIQPIESQLSKEQLSTLYKNHCSLDMNQTPFCIVKKSDMTVHTLDKLIMLNDKNNISNYSDYYFTYSEPTCKSAEYASWTIRNYIVFLLHHCPALHGKTVEFVAFRISRLCSTLSAKPSTIFNVTLPDFCGDVKNIIFHEGSSNWIGWERNERSKLGPRMSNMKDSLDPKSLFETSVDLNLKLMKWRIMPTIDLDKIKNANCLLLGSGTLGCSVARVLLGWGVRNIDIVDNSNVSYTNPVRQSLFTFQDSVQAKPKAIAAADNLKLIFPGVNANGYQLTIPMPGHTVGESLLQQTKENVDKLTELISKADIVFLLMDSRESRWLPTVLGMHFGKLVINAALGFDTYLVMRHGVRVDNQNDFKSVDGFKMIPGNNLGCYFCNDVTAPGNSMKDRTLDQQCTVTRPGISQIAGALAVELAISVLQHEHGSLAPAYYKMQKTSVDVDMENECILGILPHSIRGFLSTFMHVLPATERYKQCIACSEPVLKEYKERNFEFLLEVFETSKSLEELTGLSEIYNIDNNEVWELSDNDEDDI